MVFENPPLFWVCFYSKRHSSQVHGALSFRDLVHYCVTAPSDERIAAVFHPSNTGGPRSELSASVDVFEQQLLGHATVAIAWPWQVRLTAWWTRRDASARWPLGRVLSAASYVEEVARPLIAHKPPSVPTHLSLYSRLERVQAVTSCEFVMLYRPHGSKAVHILPSKNLAICESHTELKELRSAARMLLGTGSSSGEVEVAGMLTCTDERAALEEEEQRLTLELRRELARLQAEHSTCPPHHAALNKDSHVPTASSVGFPSLEDIDAHDAVGCENKYASDHPNAAERPAAIRLDGNVRHAGGTGDEARGKATQQLHHVPHQQQRRQPVKTSPGNRQPVPTKSPAKRRPMTLLGLSGSKASTPRLPERAASALSAQRPLQQRSPTTISSTHQPYGPSFMYDNSPGPARYDTKSDLGSGPAFTMAPRWRDKHLVDRSPGPAHYNVSGTLGADAVPIRIAARQPAKAIREVTPGPGHYDQKSTLGVSNHTLPLGVPNGVPNGHQRSKARQWMEPTNTKDNPGPGAYEQPWLVGRDTNAVSISERNGSYFDTPSEAAGSKWGATPALMDKVAFAQKMLSAVLDSVPPHHMCDLDVPSFCDGITIDFSTLDAHGQGRVSYEALVHAVWYSTPANQHKPGVSSF